MALRKHMELAQTQLPVVKSLQQQWRCKHQAIADAKKVSGPPSSGKKSSGRCYTRDWILDVSAKKRQNNVLREISIMVAFSFGRMTGTVKSFGRFRNS